ncbi:unnamed protein product [Cladocopium goreaui]|uniref:Acetylxylan esterase n=1 Tax=Cladocopium goreaui TaxID=2562237 RepID=A0A9P1M458_9DINO|nr:unnamed protein product [Cladocopium goreaui]|mmetsp:Transcript_40817/g.88433  ORF Transcript_40817/g.88433 Transcript_40817/m.88433 type:complete len:124 (-) Transcript_40817:79-450(-)
MALTFLVRVLLCSVVFMPSFAQNLKGSSSGIAEMAEVVSKDAHAVQNLEVTDSASDISLDDLPKKHPPTTNQALVSMVLIFVIPAIGLVIMYKGKEAGWTGAFGLICCLITCVWIYTAVLAFM